MNTCNFIITSVVFAAFYVFSSAAVGQPDETKAQSHRDASIKRMQQRVTEIESEMKQAELPHAQALGEEALNLLGQIDQTYTQMKDAYQQQVIELNLRMQRKWEQVESADSDDRKSINASLEQLEKDWDRTFERLTKAHESHLAQLGERVAKLRGEFSDAVGRAQAELEASNFEAVARWEKGHDILLTLNRTYVKIVSQQLRWKQNELAKDPGNEELALQLAGTRVRYASGQERFQQRLGQHVEHLKSELKARLAQLNGIIGNDTRRDIVPLVDSLYARTHKTFEMLQASYRDVNASKANELNLVSSEKQLVNRITKEINSMKSTLSESYLARVDFTDQQIIDLESRIAKRSSSEEQATWKAKLTDLRLLSRSLELKAARLVEPSRTLHR